MSAEAVPEIELSDNAAFVVDAREDFVPERLKTPGGTQDPVKDYLKGISKTPLLSAEQEVEIAKRIEAGLFASQLISAQKNEGNDKKVELGDRQILATWLGQTTLDELEWLAEDGRQAKQHMLEANLRLVVSIAKKYIGRGMPYLDLIQEGNLGLIHAVEKFDYTKGFKFSTYSTWWIKQAIMRSLQEKNRVIRIPVHMAEKIDRMHRRERDLLRELDHEPTIDELAESLGEKRETIVNYKKYSHDAISLDIPIGDGGSRVRGETSLSDLIEDASITPIHEVAEFNALQRALIDILDTLTEKEAGVISMRFGLADGSPQTLDDIGKIYGVTRERIRQIESKTLSKLRHPSRSGHLRDYLK